MLPDAGANSLLTSADLPEDLVAGAGHLHVSGYSLMNPGSRDAAVAGLATAHAAGVVTSVDPASSAPLEAVGGSEFLAMTAGVGLVFVTPDEAEVLCDSRDPLVVGARLTATYAEVVVKLGAGRSDLVQPRRTGRRERARRRAAGSGGRHDRGR